MMNFHETSIRRYQRLAAAVMLVGCGGAGAWAELASISGAVVAPAVVAVESNAKKVQHLEGGIIAESRVRIGDRVAAGDVLVRLDETEARANLAILQAQLREIRARKARLLAERDDRAEVECASGDEQSSSVCLAQTKLLKARLEVRNGKKQQFGERIGQLEEAVRGLDAQAQSKEHQIAFIRQELSSLYKLRESKLVPQTRWLALEREAARLEGERGQLVADIARTKVQIGETRLQLLGLDQSLMSEVLAELSDVEAKDNELAEKVVAIRARLERMAIKAPRSGVIHKLTATTVGAVIGAGEVIAEIVPDEDQLVLEAKVEPGSIDRLRLQQRATVRFPAFDRPATPELEGVVTMIAPDAKQDAVGQSPYYIVRVGLARSEAPELAGHVLKPGMPAELLFQTGRRSVLSYLVKPLSDQMARSLRER